MVHIIILMPSVIDEHVPDIPHSVLILVKQAEAIVIPCSLICMLPPPFTYSFSLSMSSQDFCQLVCRVVTTINMSGQ